MVVGEALAHKHAALGAEVLERLARGRQEGQGELQVLALGAGVDADGAQGAADGSEVLEEERDDSLAKLLDQLVGADLLLWLTVDPWD